MSSPRTFDHDEALRLRADGLTYEEIGRRLGATGSAVLQAVKRATDAKWRERTNAYFYEWQRQRYKKPCIDCGDNLAWHQQGRPGRCITCEAKRKATSVRADTLLCRRCGNWLPDEDFQKQSAAIARRHRSGLCRACQTIARQAYRERQKVPCETCGAPCLPAREKGPRGSERNRCLACYRARSKSVA